MQRMPDNGCVYFGSPTCCLKRKSIAMQADGPVRRESRVGFAGGARTSVAVGKLDIGKMLLTAILARRPLESKLNDPTVSLKNYANLHSDEAEESVSHLVVSRDSSKFWPQVKTP
jgi:hypothetical protein